MVEKIITLENIPLTDFLGVENQNINDIASAFPKSKIVSRGNEIRIQGSSPEIIQINSILNSLVEHYHKFGTITNDQIKTYLNQEEDKFVDSDGDVLIYGTKGFKIAPKSKNQKKLVEAVHKKDLVFAIGPAGTGKTYISVALAVKALKDRDVKKIIITRPAVEAGENLGFLPGDLKEKIDPYLRPIYDALHDMVPGEKLRYYMENGVIEIAPLAYMRGRTLNDAFILLDEAQNTTPMQIKMFLTRMGPNSKVIVTGDMSQIDLPTKQKSGMAESLKILKNIKDIGFVELDGKDVIRHKLVRSIIEAYDKEENS
ncbi:phosphate starvation-inducible protein PhoH [Reichenbachiella faecimaris]|uniref:PhoH-like protein n=1 Tax=Reichenbachiella faecimaris TaxID=692418 RepID=A0A1W2G7I9_REIFA|nr:PhoH family protein [Reichenbachiella faecimaris]SMD32308.1 phosphate starvation-inducible protein PhoH [Reichenbachiella faecimaris]